VREEDARIIMADSITLEFPSSYKYLNLVDLICAEFIGDMDFDHQAANEISISVIEACTNALEHGNKCCPEKNVRVSLTKCADRLIIEVYDHGEGFDFRLYLQHIPDPSDIHKLRGRGIYIMKHMMDALRFERAPERGIKVTLEKLVRKRSGEVA
jgi:serine/threonine-protein kinase RsbW